ncbi:MAG: tetratricopeptide repeat protein [Bryobacteraceae bacterium]
MQFGRLLFFLAGSTPLLYASSVSILVIPLKNESQAADLNWIGESVSETIMTELSAAGQIVLNRDVRNEGYRRLGIKPDTLYTKATLFKLGQTIDAGLVCYGAYEIVLPSANSQPRDGSIRISARFLDLRKLRDASEFSETGKLADLSRLEEHLAWQTIRFVDPQTKVTAEQLLVPAKLIRLDAKESYIRGLLATSREQKQKWFEQSAKLDAKYTQPEFELGKLAMNARDYRQAVYWFGKIPQSDPLYLEAKFKMGLSSYLAADYLTAKSCFRELAQTTPLNEVFNDLGAAESRLHEATASDDFRRALDGDSADPTYNFNYAVALYRQGRYEEAAQHLRSIIDRSGPDSDASAVLARCEQHLPLSPSDTARSWPPERVKDNFDLAAFRQLKAMIQNSK